MGERGGGDQGPPLEITGGKLIKGRLRYHGLLSYYLSMLITCYTGIRYLGVDKVG